MTPKSIAAVWLVANVAAALAFGALQCLGPVDSYLFAGVVFGVPQALALARASSALRWWWLPLTAIVTPLAMYVSFVSSLISLQAMQHSELPRAVGERAAELLTLAAGAAPGWAVVALAQAVLLGVAGMRSAWLWIPAVLVGGIGLDQLGVAAMAAGFSPAAVAGAPRCVPTESVGGPLGWIAAGVFYAIPTSAVLYRMRARIAAPG